MGYYLLNNPNKNGMHYYPSRRNQLRVIVMHVTAGLEAHPPVADYSAERTARYAATTNRKVSWHSGSDTDSYLYLLPPTFTAWHCESNNSYTYGHEISKATTDWTNMSPLWVTKTLFNAAECLKPIVYEFGIPFKKLNQEQVDDGQYGFIGHHELRPNYPPKRFDPGFYNYRDTFPWQQFFAMFGSKEQNTTEEDMIFVGSGGGHQWAMFTGTRERVQITNDTALLQLTTHQEAVKVVGPVDPAFLALFKIAERSTV